MAKINNKKIYNLEDNPSLEDYLIGSKNDTGKTRNFPILGLVHLVNSVNGKDNIQFVFSDGSNEEIDYETTGAFFTDTNAVEVENFSKLIFNKATLGNIDLSILFSFIGQRNDISIKLEKPSNLNEFYLFKITGFEENEEYFTFTVESFEELHSGEFVNGTIYSIYWELTPNIYQPDVLIRSVPPTRVGNTFTYPALAYEAILDKTKYINQDQFVTTIDAAQDNYKRTDLVYMSIGGALAKLPGDESLNEVIPPTVPDGAIAISYINIFGAIVEEPTEPIGDPTKLDRGTYTGNAQNLFELILALDQRVRDLEFPDTVLKVGAVVLDDLSLSVAENEFQWRLNQVEFLGPLAYTTTLDAATDEFIRYDLLAGNNSGAYVIKKGIEGETSADIPTADPGTIALSVIAIKGDRILQVIPEPVAPFDPTTINNRLDALENAVAPVPPPQTGLTAEAYVIWSGEGFKYYVNYPAYYINGVLYPSGTDEVTLPNGESLVNPDKVFHLITLGTGGVGYAAGVTDENPVIPTIDENILIPLTSVLINAGEVLPTNSGAKRVQIYDENIEWAVKKMDNGVTINPNYTGQAFKGVKSLQITNFGSGREHIVFDKPNPAFDNVKITDYHSLAFRIYLPSNLSSNTAFNIWFERQQGSGGTVGRVSSIYDFTNGKFGYNENLKNVWQLVVIPLTVFDFSQIDFNSLWIRRETGDRHFLLDDIALIGPEQTIVTVPTTSKSKGIKTIITDEGLFTATVPEDLIQMLGDNGIKTYIENGKLIVDGFDLLQDAIDYINGRSLQDVVTVNKTADEIELTNTVVQGAIFPSDYYFHKILPTNDGKIYMYGGFNSVNGVTKNRIVRLNSGDMSIDESFNIGSGFNTDGYTGCTMLQLPSNEILISGAFNQYNGITKRGIVALQPNGQISTTFDVGVGISGIFNYVLDLKYNTEKTRVFVCGSIETYKGTPCSPCLIALDLNGNIDTSYNFGTGFNNVPTSLVVNEDNTIIVTGFFSNYKGVAAPRICKLLANGNRDTSFNAGTGFNTNTTTQNNYIFKDHNGIIIAYGHFTLYNGVSANRIVGLNQDGTVYNGYNFGTGLNSGSIEQIRPIGDGTIAIRTLGATSYQGNTITNTNGWILVDENYQFIENYVRYEYSQNTEINNNIDLLYGVPYPNDSTRTIVQYVGKEAIVNNKFTFSKENGKAEYFNGGLKYATDDEILPKKQIEELIGQSVDNFNLSSIAYVDAKGNNTTAIIGNIKKPFLTIDAALDALPSTGGVIRIGVGSFNSPTGSKIKSNTYFIGSKEPEVNSTVTISAPNTRPVITAPTALINGTILLGEFSALNKNNIIVSNLGVDVGKTWVDTFNGGVTVGGLVIASIEPTAPIKNIQVSNVTVLGYSPTTAQHCMLFENIIDSKFNNLTTYYHVHGVALKGLNITMDGLSLHSHNNDGLIIKSDTYAPTRDVSVNNVNISSLTGYEGGGIILEEGVNGASLLERICLNNINLKHVRFGLNNVNKVSNVNISNLNLYDSQTFGIKFGGGGADKINLTGLNIVQVGSEGVDVSLSGSESVNISNSNISYASGVGYKLTTTGNSIINLVNSNTLNTTDSYNITGNNVYGSSNFGTGTTTGYINFKNPFVKSLGRIFSVDDNLFGDLATTNGSLDFRFSNSLQIGTIECNNFTSSLKKPLEISSLNFNVSALGSIVATSYTGGATLTGTPTAPTAAPGTNTNQIATMAALQTAIAAIATARPYKCYKALMNQVNTNAPLVTISENNLGGTISWVRTNTGIYTGTLIGAFTSGKTYVFITLGVRNSGITTPQTVFGVRASDDTIVIQTLANGSLTDSILDTTSIEIQVYS